MSIQNAINKFRSLAAYLNENREKESIIIANDLAALIRLRVETDKQDSDGRTFDEYSKAVVPQYYFWGKSISQGAEDKLRAGDWFLSYETFRDINGREIDAKNYSFTGDMWRNFGITIVDSNKSTTEISIGGQTDRAAQLIRYHTERDGDIIAPNEQEVEFVVQAHSERIINAITAIFQ